MFVQPSRHSHTPFPLLKGTRSFSKIESIQQKIFELTATQQLLKELVTVHHLFFYKKGFPYHALMNSSPDSSAALIQRNLYEQKYFRSIPNLEIFEKELLNDEEGTFTLALPGYIVSEGGFTIPFKGETLTILKRIENDEKTYLVASSLSRFWENELQIYSQDRFMQHILTSLHNLQHSNQTWDFQACVAHYKLTRINIIAIINSIMPSEAPILSQFGRTSNVALEDDRKVLLGTIQNGTYQWPKGILLHKE